MSCRPEDTLPEIQLASQIALLTLRKTYQRRPASHHELPWQRRVTRSGSAQDTSLIFFFELEDYHTV